MKKMVLISTAIFMTVMGALLSGAGELRAAGMSVGANAWYVQWDRTPSNDTDIDPGLMYGPVAGFDWGRNWSLTSVFLTGNFKAKMPPSSGGMELNYRRYDSDTTLNYAVLKWFKMFGGFKYIRYELKGGNLDEFGTVLMPFEGGDIKHTAYGPGAGIGITLPLADSLFVLGNFSVMYLFGKDILPGEPAARFNGTGYNATMGLAYYLDSISTTVTAGVRYQYFKDGKPLGC